MSSAASYSQNGVDWWHSAPELAETIATQGSARTRSAWYRFGDGFLQLESNIDSLLGVLSKVYGECSSPAPARVNGATVRCTALAGEEPRLYLLKFGERDRDPAELTRRALSLLEYQHLGFDREYREMTSPVPGWLLVEGSDAPGRPLLAAGGSSMLVDMTREPWRFLTNYLVSMVMGIQRDVVFVHAGSVGIHQAGVLLAEGGIEQDLSGTVPLGVIGVIPTKVCGEGGAIAIGDLLVTSSTAAHAMKADKSKLGFGMVLGKALEPFEGTGEGVIKVLVNVK